MGDRLRISDLRIGYAPNFVFAFDYARANGKDYEAIDPVQVEPDSPRPQQVRALLAAAATSLEDCDG